MTTRRKVKIRLRAYKVACKICVCKMKLKHERMMRASLSLLREENSKWSWRRSNRNL